MSSPKPADLVAIRKRLKSAQSFTMRLRDIDAPAMADEIEQLRAGLETAIGVIGCAGVFPETLAQLRALLPPR